MWFVSGEEALASKNPVSISIAASTLDRSRALCDTSVIPAADSTLTFRKEFSSVIQLGELEPFVEDEESWLGGEEDGEFPFATMGTNLF